MNEQTGLQSLDWILIGLYAASTIGIGWYFGRKQRSTEEYFVGSGNMNPVLVGVSLFATLLSTISYLSRPGEALGKGPVMTLTLLAYPIIYLIIAFGMLPVYMRQRVTSAYELLEAKLGIGIRLLGAVMFVLLRLVWMSLLVYLAAKAMVVMLGIEFDWSFRMFGIPFSIAELQIIVVITGVVAVIYTSIGGLRAVVITDFLQTVLLLGGALLVIITITYKLGGVSWFPTEWNPEWDTQPLFSFDPRTRVTVVGTVLSYLTWYVCTAGGDQVSVQRYMATRDVAAARRALATQLSVGAIVTITLGLVGFALLGYFQTHPELLPSDMTLKDNADEIFPLFIAYHLPVGISGLVVSAMFAAAMSSIDSGVNSITAVVTTDFLDRFGMQPKTKRGHVVSAKSLAFVIGAIVVFGSTFMEHIPGNIMAVTNKTVNLVTAPIFCLFFFALFVPFARPAAVWLGAICGILVAAIIAFSGPLVTWLDMQWGIPVETFGVQLKVTVDSVTGNEQVVAEDPISFLWIGPMSMLVNLIVGTVASWMLSKFSPVRGTIQS